MSNRANSVLARSSRPSFRSNSKPVLNHGSDLARGLIAWYVPSVNNGVNSKANAKNYAAGDVTKFDMVVSSQAPSLGVDEFGYYFDYGTTSQERWHKEELDDKVFRSAAPMTMAAWIRIREVGIGQCILWQGRSDENTEQMGLAMDATDVPVLMHYTGAFTSVAGTTSVSVGDIVHVCGVWEADDSRRIYVNGLEENSNTDNDAWISSGDDRIAMGMFRDGTPSAPTGNPTYEAAVWNRALNPGEVWRLYHHATRWDLHWQPKLMVPGPGIAGLPPVVVVPAAAFALGDTEAPTLILGSTTSTPDAAFALGHMVDPTTVQGSTTAAPDAALALGLTRDPTTVQGSMTVTSPAAFALGHVVQPITVLGSITLTPGTAFSLGFTVDPNVQEGSITIIPQSAFALGVTRDPTLVMTSITVTAQAAFALGFTEDPTTVLGSITISPDAAFALSETLDPAVILGSIIITPNPSFGVSVIVDPTVVQSSMTVTVNPAFALGDTAAPSVDIETLRFGQIRLRYKTRVISRAKNFRPRLQ
jgi:hypothetical protein